MTRHIGLKFNVTLATSYQGDDPSWTNKPNPPRIVKHYEIALFLKDGGHTIINDKKYTITAGSIRFLRPNDKVISGFFPQAQIVFFEADNVKLSQEAFALIPRFLRCVNIEKDSALLNDLMQAFAAQDSFECSSCLWKFLRQMKENSNGLQNTKSISTILQIRNYIDDNYNMHLTLDNLASEFHMNPDYLQRKFKQKFNQSPAEYQLEVRLSQAVAMLITSDLSVEAIAELCGFSNSSHFIRTFKKKKNVTPSQFKQNYFSTISFT